MIAGVLYSLMGCWTLVWDFGQPHWHGREWAAFALALLCFVFSLFCFWGVELEKADQEREHADGD